MSMSYKIYEDCTLCPRECHVNRRAGQLGFCGASCKVRVARAALHYWEEPPISGDNGSGTVFFAHCQLQCAYCQNSRISRARIDASQNPWAGVEVTASMLARIFMNLESKGANNINLVSATQYLPTVSDAIEQARGMGLAIPIVFNTGGYESVSALRAMSGLIDVYLADFKHWSADAAARYAHAPNYPEVARHAIAEMVAQTGAPDYMEMPTGEAVLARGTIVRHLLLPGQLDDAESIVRYLGAEYGGEVVLSLMSQYVPLADPAAYPEIARKVDMVGYDNLVDLACAFDFDECFVQEEGSADAEYIPSFDGEGVLGGVVVGEGILGECAAGDEADMGGGRPL